MAFLGKLQPRLRLFAIYRELGYVPWRKPVQERKPVKAGKRGDSVYMGAREAIIPFLNGDTKRTFSHLLLRPGYMIRDYIRGQHERYLAPFTALLVFYSVFTLLMAIIQPGSTRSALFDVAYEVYQEDSLDVDLTGVDRPDDVEYVLLPFIKNLASALIVTRLDQYPAAADTPWKQSLAAIEGDLRSKGIPMFLDNFLFMWLAMAVLLRKKYQVSLSGAAAASAYVLCQFCLFMFLALLLTFGDNAKLSFALTAVLLFIDYRQWLKIDNKTAFWLTVKTGFVNLLFRGIYYLLLGGVLAAIAYYQI